MDGIVPPTSTRQPFGLYAATSASLAHLTIIISQSIYQTVAAGRAIFFRMYTIYRRHYRGPYREEKKKILLVTLPYVLSYALRHHQRDTT